VISGALDGGGDVSGWLRGTLVLKPLLAEVVAESARGVLSKGWRC